VLQVVEPAVIPSIEGTKVETLVFLYTLVSLTLGE
jgi:hypothetical protein